MRQLTLPRRRARGVTLIELMVGLAIAAILALAAAPFFGDYVANSRLRENGNTLYVQALLAQSEAIKRNTTVRLATDGGTIQIIDRTVPAAPVVLFTRTLTEFVTLPTVNVDFVGEGRPANFAAAAINLSSTSSVTCSSDIRCPGLRIDGGGAIRLCGNHLDSCP